MKIELRADNKLHISGYVNVTGKLSKPVVTPRGKCVETIEERAFDKAIKASGDIYCSLDHDSGHAYAGTSDGTLKLTEDAIGLHAEVIITDDTVIELARKGKIKGWSFGMYNVKDEMEERADGLPIRHVKEFLLDHVTLVSKKTPYYSATSVELRAGEETDVELRAIDCTVFSEIQAEKPDFTDYERRLNSL